MLSDLPDESTFADIDAMLAKYFDQSKTSWQALHEIDSASRKADETVREFARRVEHMIKVANQEAGPITLQRQAIKQLDTLGDLLRAIAVGVGLFELLDLLLGLLDVLLCC